MAKLWDQRQFGATDLARSWPAATSDPPVQAVQRSAIRTKLKEIVGVYVNPPNHAIVLSVDEKSQIQALDRTSLVAARSAVLSVITGGGKWVEITTHADPLYQHLIVTAERKFWRCVETGEPPRLFGVEPPKPRIEAVRMVDMSSSNAWAEFAATFARTRPAYLEHEKAKAELKSLVSEDAQQAVGHGVRARRSKAGTVTFDLLKPEDGHAAV